MDFISLNPEQEEEHKYWIELFESKYLFKFYPPSYDKVPHASRWFGGDLKRYISRLEYNLLGTYIIDMNTNNHGDMHRIRHEFTKEEYRWHQKHNKLGVNLIDSNGITLVLLQEDLNKRFTLMDFPSEKYSSMTFQQKTELMTKFDENTYDILEQLSREYTHTRR